VKKILLLVLIILSLPAANARDATDEELKAFFSAINTKAGYQAGLDGMIEIQKTSVPDFYLFESTFRDWIEQYLTWEAVEGEVMEVYRSYFTGEEIVKLTEFYLSEVGEKYTVKLPFITKESMQIGSTAAQKHQKELQEMIRVKIELLQKQGIYKPRQ